MNITAINTSLSSKGRTGILLVAFGSSTPVGNSTLSGFEGYVRQSFPHTSIRWAFTSSSIRSKLVLAKKKIDSVEKALKRMQFEKITNIIVQPLHIIPGIEYDNLRLEIEKITAANKDLTILLGKPLLFNKQSIAKAASALLHHLPDERNADEPVICMGHGSWHRGSLGYTAFNKEIASKDPLVFIGTLEGRQTIDRIVKVLHKEYPVNGPAQQKSANANSKMVKGLVKNMADCGRAGKKVWLMPLLSVIGYHALHDMAGDAPGSWKHTLEMAGYNCEVILKGTAEYEQFITIWTEHIEDALARFHEDIQHPGGNV